MSDTDASTADVPGGAPGVPLASFDTTTIVTVSAAHLVHDSYPAFVGVLLPLLIPKLGIGLVVAGLLASTFRLATEKLNIDYAYMSFAAGKGTKGTAQAVVKVNDLQKAQRAVADQTSNGARRKLPGRRPVHAR